MTPVSSLANSLRDTDPNAFQSSMEVYQTQRNSGGQIIDFKLVMLNAPALAMWGRPERELIGRPLSLLLPDGEAQFLIRQFSLVAEFGRTVQFEMDLHEKEARRANSNTVSVAQMADGVVVTTTGGIEPTADRFTERQAEMYKTILDTALTSISLLEAVRDDNDPGKIIDFCFRLVNQERLRLADQPESFFIGKKLTELYPGMRESGVFDRWVEVVETQQPQQFELHYTYDGYDDWSLCLGSPFGDGLVVSYADITKQKQDELQARQQAELLTSIQQASQTAIVALKAQRDQNKAIVDFKFVLRNAAALKLAGRPMEELAGKTLLDLYPQIQSENVFELYVQVVERGLAKQYEQYYVDNGVEVWLEVSVQPWGDGVVVNALDSSRIRQAERENQQQSAILQQVIDNTQAGLVMVRPVRNGQSQITDFRYVLTNEYNARTTGRSVSEMMGALVSDLFPDWQDSDLFRQYVEVVETGQLQRLVFPYEAYGMKGWFDGSFSCVDGCLLYTYTDVTPLKEAELAQQKYAELLEQVMNMTPAAIVLNESIRNEAGEVVDLRMTKLNQMAADLLQNPIEKIQYRRISKYLPGSLDTPLFEQCKQVIQTGEPARLEVPWIDRWYDFSVARFGDGIVLTAQDITPMKESQHKLEVANLELKRSNENLQSFAFVSSHDLQEPLRKITSFATILQTQYGTEFDANATDIIERINTSADRMRLLIQDLLAYSKLETRQDLFKPVDITKLIHELEEHELWSALNQTRAEIHLSELPTLVADPLQMHQLFQNLLSNALKFCQKDVIPSITVSSRLIDRADIPSNLLYTAKPANGKSVGNTFYEITVADNGIGFDEKYVDRIFQVFQRLHGRSQHAGSGIGLAICYKIVERHGGAITANSQPGVGSTFRVYLPVRKEVA